MSLALAAATLGYAEDAVGTVAGSAGQAGYVNETGGAARFRFFAVAGAVVDSGGNLYVADGQNNAIRKITPAGVVTTFAGSTSGTAGGANGNGTSATFNSPEGVAIDSADNLYVADTGNHLIRKITAAGDVTTIAGSGTAGYTNATGTSAEFRSPTGVAVAPRVGAATTLFVADSQNNVIRRIDLGTGAVTNVAGSTSGAAGWTDSTDADVRFSGPVAVLADATGTTLYVADTGNHDVRKVVIAGPTATVTTLAGTDTAGYANGTGADARFTAPRGLAFDADGNILVGDSGTQTVRKVTPAGAVTLLAGTASAAGAVDALATNGAKFNGPSGLAVAGAAVYVVDAGNQTVRKISAAAAPAITTDPVSTTVTVGSAATFTTVATGNPTVTYRWQRLRTGDAAFANLADGGTYSGTTTATLTITGVTALMSGDKYRVVATNALGSANSAEADLIPTLGLVFSTLAGQPGASGAVNGVGSNARFWAPLGVAVNVAGLAYVADTTNQVIRTVTAAGSSSTFAGQFGTPGSVDGAAADARFSSPSGLALDSSGNLYVADTGNQTIRKVLPNGAVSTVAGATHVIGATDGPAADARFAFPGGVAVDSAGVLYVADTLNHTIRKIAVDGTVSTLAGLAGSSGSADGNGAAARFNLPYGVAVDAAGNVYVADTQNSTIRRITPAGDVTTLAGTAGQTGTTDDTGAAARFNQPKGIMVVNATTLYVADTMNHTLRKVLTSGAVTTLAGTAGSAGSSDAIGTAAKFNEPSALALDASGNLYVADTKNHTIRRTGAYTAPAVQTQPTDQTTQAGTAVTFAATASGLPAPSFQWQRQAAGTSGFFNIDDGASFSGTTTASLNVLNPTEAMTGDRFRVVATNLVSPAAISREATLTVGPANLPPTIIAQPVAATVGRGEPVLLSVVVSGSGALSYQWWKDGAVITGATAATLSLPSVEPANTGSYAVVVTNNFGTATSTPVSVTLNTAPLVTTPQRAQVGLAGGSVSLAANVTGAAGTTYQWRKNGTNIGGATNATLTLSALTAADAGLYDVVAANALGKTTTALVPLTISSTATTPVITAQPTPQTVAAGAAVSFSVSAMGAPAPTYQWRKSGTPVVGATNATLNFISVQAVDAADYDVVVTNSSGSATSSKASLRVLARNHAGTYFGSFGNGLGTFALLVRADNTGVFLGAIPTATAPISTLALSVNETGEFSFVQPAGTGTGALGAVTVSGSLATGNVTGTLSGAVSATMAGNRSNDQGATQTIAGLYLAGALDGAGYTLSLVSATGQVYALTRLDGVADGGTGAATSGGQIAVNTGRTAVTGTITPATGTLVATAIGAVNGSFTGASELALQTQRLANLSTRARVSGGDAVAIAGFVIEGENSKLLLIRAVGPTLSDYGVSGVLAAPKLELFRGQSLIASNVGASTAPDAAAITAAAVAAGAFAPTPNPADSVLLITLPPGTYTAQVSAANAGSGVALVEVYDLSATEPGQKLLNMSTRAAAGTADATLIAGVVVTGAAPKRVLIRAVGPGLSTYQVGGVLAQPVLTLKTQSGQTIVQNTGWSTSTDAAAITAAGHDVGAFPLVTGDSAMIVTLPPGSYSAQVTGAGGTTGIALVELYELQ